MSVKVNPIRTKSIVNQPMKDKVMIEETTGGQNPDPGEAAPGAIIIGVETKKIGMKKRKTCNPEVSLPGVEEEPSLQDFGVEVGGPAQEVGDIQGRVTIQEGMTGGVPEEMKDQW